MKKIILLFLLLNLKSFLFGQTITITAPTCSSNWVTGMQQTIAWTSSGVSNPVTISFSTDSGTNWIILDPSYPSLDGSNQYSWYTISPTTNTLIKIKENITGGAEATSDNFSINPGSKVVVISSPANGSNYFKDDNLSIAWSKMGISGNATIEYSTNGGATWTLIESVWSLDDSPYNWTVPNVTSSNCVIRLNIISDPAIPVFSGVFSITSAPLGIFVTSPVTGDTLYSGDSWCITWDDFQGGMPSPKFVKSNDRKHLSVRERSYAKSKNFIEKNKKIVKLNKTIIDKNKVSTDALSNSVDIMYSTNGGTDWTMIEEDVYSSPGFGNEYGWSPIPNTPSNNCKISINGYQSQTFSIVTPPFKFIHPEESTYWKTGSQHYIILKSSGTQSPITLKCYDYDSYEEVIVSNYTCSDGNNYFLWTVPSVEGSYFLEVTQPDNPSFSYLSESFCVLNDPSPNLSITSPVGGENWGAGVTHNITWESYGITNPVQIWLYKDPDWLDYELIADNVLSPDGINNFSWTVPNSQSNTCRIEIYEPISYADTYSDYFTISTSEIVPDVLYVFPTNFDNYTNEFDHSSPVGSVYIDRFKVINSSNEAINILNMNFENEYMVTPYQRKILGKSTLNRRMPPKIRDSKESQKNQSIPILTENVNQVFKLNPALNVEQSFEVIQNPAPVSIPPNDSIEIAVKITCNEVGQTNKKLVMKTNAAGADSILNVRFALNVVNSIIGVNINSIDFGMPVFGKGPLIKTFKIFNNGTTQLLFLPNFLSGKNAFKFSLQPEFAKKGSDNKFAEAAIPVNPGETRDIYIACNCDSIGLLNDTLVLQNNSVNDQEVAIPVKANVIAPVTISIDKQAIDYGTSGYMSSSKDSIITVQNNSSERALILQSYSFDKADNIFEVLDQFPITLQPFASVQLQVRFNSRKTGVYDNTLKIQNTSDNNPEVQISLNGIVTGSTISVNPKNIDFGEVGFLTSPRDTIISITNSGQFVLNISYDPPKDSSFVIIGENPAGGININPGETYRGIKIRLLTNRMGSKTDTLKILSNSSNSPVERIIITTKILSGNLVCTPSSLDFGSTSSSLLTIKKKIIINNSGMISVTIAKKSISGDSVSFTIVSDSSSKTLLPGTSDTVEIVFSPHTSGTKTATLKIKSTDSLAKEQEIPLTGFGGGGPVINIFPVEINFGDIFAGLPRDTSIFIKNEGNLDLNITAFSFMGDNKEYFSLVKGNLPSILPYMKTDTFIVRAYGRLPFGKKTARLKIISNDSSGNSSNVNLTGVLRTPILVKPINSFALDSVPVGVTHDTIITIKNAGNYLCNINKIYFDGPGASDFSASELQYILPDEEKQLVIHFTPKAIGERNARLVIFSSDPENPEQSIIIRGFGKGNPIITVQNILNFGYVDSNKAKELPLIIKNTGFTPLLIKSLNITGINSALFKLINVAAPFEIKDSDSSKVIIKYLANPAIKGPSAKLQILSDDLNNPLKEVDLITSSIRPFITADTILNFEALAINDSSSLELIITNNSTVFFTIDTLYFDLISDNPFKVSNPIFPIQVNPAGKFPLKITFIPKMAKSYSMILNLISSNASNSPYRVRINGSAKKPGITTSLNFINFNYVGLDNTKDTILSISNSGQVNLQIDSMNITGMNSNLFSVIGGATPFIIEPSKTKDVTIRFAPGQNRAFVLANLRIISNDLDKPVISIPLSGSGDIPAIALDSLIDFGNVVVFDSIKKDFKISNTSFVNLTIDSISITQDVNNSFSFSGIKLPFTIGSKGSVTFAIKYNPKVSKSNLAYLNISSSRISGISLKVKLLGGVTAPQLTVQKPILFGKLKVDSSKTIKVPVNNSGDGYLSISQIYLSGKDTSEFSIIFKTVPIKINPGLSDTVTITFKPKSIGKKDIKLFIISNDKSSPLEVTIDAEGFKQNLLADPVVVNFGEVSFQVQKSDSILLKNYGTENIIISSFSFTGSGSSQFTFLNINPPNSLTLLPNESKVILIGFKPDSIGTRTGNLQILSNDRTNPQSLISLSGTCITPTIKYTENQINFPSMRPGTIWDSVLIFNNNGVGELVIKSIKISGKDSNDFKILKGNIGKIIRNGEKDTVIIRFMPISVGDKSASIVINSNDYYNRNAEVLLSGKGITPRLNLSLLKIDFGKLFVIKTKDTSFTVINGGTDNLLLKNISVTGSDSLKFTASSSKYPVLKNIMLTAGETLEIKIRFYPQSTGIKTANILFESDDPSQPILNIPLNGEGYIPSFVINSDLAAVENTDKIINFTLSDNYFPSTLKIFYRKGGQTKYDSVPVVFGNSFQSANDINLSYTFNKNLITRNGLDFYIKATWNGAEATLPLTNYSINPLSFSIKLANLNSAFQLITKEYSMITIPLRFQGTTLLNEIIRNLGTVNSSSWRIFKWRNGDYEEYIDETGWILQPGDGFWFIASENKVIDFQNCTTVPTGTPYNIILQPGWNQIGSPYLFNIPYRNIIIPAGKNIENALWKWDGMNGYVLENTSLEPWTGYFIKNNESDNVTISIRASSKESEYLELNALATTLKTNEWKIKLETKINGKIQNYAEMGCLANSSDSWDINDISEPPVIFSKYYSVRFPHQDWKSNKGNYIRDYKCIGQSGGIWDMEIMNLTDDKEGQIKFIPEGNLPEGYEIILYDYDLNKSSKITGAYQFRFDRNQEIKKFKIMVGNKEYLDKNITVKVKPDAFKLSQNYPNPFNPTTLINYQIPEDGFVVLKVFDVLGREVSTLVSQYQNAGSYNVHWDTHGNPSGIYYYKLQSGKYSEMKKMIYLR